MTTSASERLQDLYLQMCRIRSTEEALGRLWQRGLMSGELHLGIGEEAVVAGVLAHLQDGDALALDYRSTPPLVARGVDLTAMFLEVLGSPNGLCGGRAGHMHLMSPPHLAAASGIVGAPGPLACGFGLAARTAGQGGVVACFFGDGAVNEGMLMEALNLAWAWQLPVVFACKDNRWAVTTRSAALTGGGLRRRLGAFGMPVSVVDGRDVRKVDNAARRAVTRARAGRGPSILLLRCNRMEGHVAGDPLGRLSSLLAELRSQLGSLSKQTFARAGAPAPQRVAAVLAIGRRAASASNGRPGTRGDPLRQAARWLPEDVAFRLADQARAEVDAAMREALEDVAAPGDAGGGEEVGAHAPHPLR